jgi:threonine/homoserine/homoserine lactone efflux protein
LGAGYLLYLGLMLLWSLRALMSPWLSWFAGRTSAIADDSNPAAGKVTEVSSSSEGVALGETEEMTTHQASNHEAAALRAFQKALLLSLTNPKAILFLMSFFIQFIDSQFAPSWLPYLVLAVVLEIISLFYLACLIYAGGKLASFFREKIWAQHFGNLLLGVLFTGFAVKLVLSS